MPFKSPESYELDRPSADDHDNMSWRNDSDESDVDDFDPLKSTRRPYKDDASQPLRSVFDSEKDGLVSSAPTRWQRRGWSRGCAPTKFCCMLAILFVTTMMVLFGAGSLWVVKKATPPDGQSEPWYPSPKGGTVKLWETSYRRAADMVKQMTLPEKVNITTGIGWSMGMCVGNTGPVDRLGFPSLCLQDGPLGLRFVDNSTAFPAAITVGASWNKQLMYDRGRAHGFEARLKGINVILGPSMGPLGRLPAGGRNWEGFGSDPVLQGIAAAKTIRGIQSQGVIATAKHYIANEQEHFRQSWEWGTPNAISSNIDDRTLHEIYAWPFAESVRAGVASVMCSYNQLNNSYACQNSKLLSGVLKDELGFQGFVQSDWLAQRSGVASALAGLDMSMPGDGLRWQDGKSLWGPELSKAVLNGSVPMDRLNDMVLRIVAAWYQMGQDDTRRWPNVTAGGGPNFSSWTNDAVGQLHPGSPSSKEVGEVNKYVPVRHTVEGGDHDELARQIAREGIVLVKNEAGILPLPKSAEGITKSGDGKLRVGIFGEDAFLNDKGINSCADRGCNEGTLAMGWGSGAVELPHLVSPADALHRTFDDDTVQVTDWKTNTIRGVDGTAAAQDVCLVFVNSDAGEGFLAWNGVKGDRNNLYPQKGGDELVEKVAANCGGRNETGYPVSDTIVVLHTVGPTILEKWIDLPSIKGVLIAHLPGQESGDALADVLFGDYNPSGRLPYTIAKQEKDYGPTSEILRVPNSIVPQQNFSEGLYIDYRHFDKQAIEPRYEFGFGMSYTEFKLSALFVRPIGLNGSEARPVRAKDRIAAPKLDPRVPSAETALWPHGFRKLEKYVYPYIDDIKQIKSGKYAYPKGFSQWHTPSAAGGGEGGNPGLYERGVEIQASVSNLGDVAGDAVVQMYVSLPTDARDSFDNPLDVPVRQLRNFEKITVEAGGRGKVELALTRKDLSYWDVGRQNWVLPKGDLKVCLAFSSRDPNAQCAAFNMPDPEAEAAAAAEEAAVKSEENHERRRHIESEHKRLL
jgi:beta-glucosidase-like glycosyl hydrolase